MRLSRSYLITITLGSLTIILVIVVIKAAMNAQENPGSQSPLQPSSNATASQVPPKSQEAQQTQQKSTLQPGSTTNPDSPQTSTKNRVYVQSLPPAITPSTPQEAPAPRQAATTSTVTTAPTQQKEVVPLETQSPPASTPTTSPAAVGGPISDPGNLSVPPQDSSEQCRTGIGIIERQVLK
jgi:hypothetical protein